MKVTRPSQFVGFEAAGKDNSFRFTVVTKNLLRSGEVIEFKIPFNQLTLVDELGLEPLECLSKSDSTLL